MPPGGPYLQRGALPGLQREVLGHQGGSVSVSCVSYPLVPVSVSVRPLGPASAQKTRTLDGMAADQRNFQMFTYTDDNGDVWNKRGLLDAAINAIDGSSALTAGARVWPAKSRRYHTREAVFFDPTTFRTVRFPVYTTAAFAAITGATTLAQHVAGNTATVTYSLSEKIAEKQPVAKSTRQLADHA